MSCGPETTGTRVPSVAELREALEDVHDAHIPVSLRRMGMVRDIDISDCGVVRIELCIPCMGCPGVGLMKDQVRDRLLQINGVTKVEIDEGMHLSWSRDQIDDEVRHLMRINGLQT